MQFNYAQLYWVDDTIQSALDKTETINELSHEFSTHFKIDGKRLLIDLLYQIAMSDGQFHSKEEAIIKTIVSKIYLPNADHTQIRALYIKTDKKKRYYDILNISTTATQDDIKKAYRAASKKHHPDKVAHLGEEFRTVAETKMQEINNAYETLYKG